MFISHLLATREVKANQGTQANEGREVKDKEDVLRHVAPRPKTPNYKEPPQITSIISWTAPADLYSALQTCPKSSTAFCRTPTQNGKADNKASGYSQTTPTEKAKGQLQIFASELK